LPARYWLFVAQINTVNITHPKILFDEDSVLQAKEDWEDHPPEMKCVLGKKINGNLKSLKVWV